MRKITVAQIGTSQNSHGRMIFSSLAKQKDLFEIKGFALPEGEREKFPKAVRAFEGYRELSVEQILKDPSIEAVVIETEEKYLTRYAYMAAKAGKHIHMEKPGSADLEEFEALIGEMKRTQKVFHTGYMYRYNPLILQLLEQIRAGELGEILAVEAQMNCIQSQEVRDWLKGYKGGMMFFLGCHLIDLILKIQGPPLRVLPMNKGADFGFALFEYEKGVSFAKTAATEIGGYARRQLVVVGSKKTVELKPLEIGLGGDMVATAQTEYNNPSWMDRGTFYQTPPFDRYEAMMAAFAAMVQGGLQNPNTYEYELQLYKTVLECCKGEEK